MTTTPSGKSTKPSSKHKRTPKPAKKKHRPTQRAHHTETEEQAIDDAIDRRLPARELQRRIRQLSRRIHKALGPRRGELWLNLEIALNELKLQREAAYFDLGFEHGFVAARSTAKQMPGSTRELAAKLRDLAIQHGLTRRRAGSVAARGLRARRRARSTQGGELHVLRRRLGDDTSEPRPRW